VNLGIVTNRCCRTAGEDCNPTAGIPQCCIGLGFDCHPTLHECVACQGLEEEYDPEHPTGCCDGLVARLAVNIDPANELCLMPCDTDACGECADGRAISGSCDGEELECDRDAAVIGADTNCDGVDDDCDGEIDEDFPTMSSCMGEAPDGRCSGKMFEGTAACEAGTQTCVVGDDDYCGVNFGSPWANYTDTHCYATLGTTCIDHDDCSPGWACLNDDSGNELCTALDDPIPLDCSGVDICWQPTTNVATSTRSSGFTSCAY